MVVFGLDLCVVSALWVCGLLALMPYVCTHLL